MDSRRRHARRPAKERVNVGAVRLGKGRTDAEKEKAQRWVDAWDTVARVHPLRRS